MAKWTDYTTDTNPTDTDEVMTLDADKSPKANKRVTLSTLADYFLDKLASKVFAKLETQNKTVIGALNELNSNAFLPKKELRMSADDVEQGAYRVDGFFPIDGEENAILLCFKIFENNQKLIVQFLIPYRCDYIKIRTHWYTSWLDWATYNPSKI